MHFPDPWHVTVIRTRGLSFVRPEKSWRPIVSISVVDEGRDPGLPHDVVLGCDGQNPNLKSIIPIHDVTPSTRLVIQVYHKSQTKKKHRKRTLVGSANLSLGEFLNRHPLPHRRPVEYDVRLACPPPQRKSPTIGGKQVHSAALTLKLAVPHPLRSPELSRPASPLSDDCAGSDGMASDGASSSKDVLPSPVDSATPRTPWEPQPNPDTVNGPTGLRRRRKHRGFRVDSDTDGYASDSSSEDPWVPPTPPDDYFDLSFEDGSEGVRGCEPEEAMISPCILPTHSDAASVSSAQRSLSLAESVADMCGPYSDLREADEDNNLEKAEKVLGRLLTEWYVVGGSLLALAAIDAAVFGFEPDAMFAVGGFSRSVVAIGAIAAGIGLVSDAWFLVLYSGANAVKFQRLAKDVYNSYFFFCLTCRLPTVCMFVSALALMLFLLGVAWTAWPTAVLVMSFAAGVLLTSQFLVFGIHRFVNFIVWVVRVSWREVVSGRQPSAPQAQLHPHSHSQSQGHSHPASQHQPAPVQHSSDDKGEGPSRISMPVPEPAPPPEA